MWWFQGSSGENPFEMFSISHLLIVALFLLVIGVIFHRRERLQARDMRQIEIGTALSLVLMEAVYHIWMVRIGIWDVSHALPLDLCSISLILTIVLLLTKKYIVYEVLLFTALLGASQAILTPLLHYGFPHFRFFHFFYTHLIIIWVAFYFTWVKGYRPTIWSVFKLLIFLNILLPIIIFINKKVDGNYMFLSQKPSTASLLDLLGPYPVYIFAMEGLLISLSLLVWIIFRKKSEQ